MGGHATTSDLIHTFTECREKTQTAECAYCNVRAIDEE